MNIYYHYTNHGRSLFRGFATVLIGVAIILWPGLAIKTLLLFLGCTLIITGVVSLATVHATEGKFYSKDSLLSITGLLTLVLGILLVSCTSFFQTLIMYLFGVILIVVGVMQFLSLLSMQTYAKVSLLQYVMSAVIFAAGIISFVNPFTASEAIVLMFGIAVTTYGASELYNTWKFRKTEYDTTIEDAEIIESE